MTRESGQTDSSTGILIVDDEPIILKSLSALLGSKNWEVYTASSAAEALAQLKRTEIPLVITDIDMPKMDGITLLKEIKKDHPHTEVIIMTGKSSEELAIQALRSGASDYFHKPLQGPEVIASLLRSQRMMEVKSQNTRLAALVSRLTKTEGESYHFGNSESSRKLLSQLKRVAEFTDATVLLMGETGAGKEVAARLLHQWSYPANAPFVAINCAGITESLLERELFGHEKGAFTGADSRSPGIFEMGLDGTVLLDEITEMSFAAQSRLLRVLEERSFRRVGGTVDIGLRSTRIVATTNKDIEALVADGRFREDLFFRLNVIPILLPPLRDRREEIPDLARHILRGLPRGSDLSLSPEAAEALAKFDYPGNVRQLRNIVEYAAVFCSSEVIQLLDLSLKPSPTAPAAREEAVSRPPEKEEGDSLNLEQTEKRLVSHALKSSPNNQSAAARALGITPQALTRRIEKFGLQDF